MMFSSLAKSISKFSQLAISVGVLASCASLQSVSLTPIPSDQSRPVKVETSRMIILGLNFDNDYVNRLVSDLKTECKGGKVGGILTKDEYINYFLGIIAKRHVEATGFCQFTKVSGL